MTSVRCWCTIAKTAQTAHVDARDRLNPGRAYYRCGNFGLGATCSFFAWAAIPAQTEVATENRIEVPTSVRKSVPIVPGIKRVEAPKKEEGPNEDDWRRLGIIEKKELVALFGERKKKRRRSKSKVTTDSTTTADSSDNRESSPSSPLSLDAKEDSPPCGGRSYSLSPPISIPKPRQRDDSMVVARFDILNELDRRQALKSMVPKESMIGDKKAPHERRPNTFPLDAATTPTKNNKRSCLQQELLDQEEEDSLNLMFPCPSFQSPKGNKRNGSRKVGRFEERC